MENEPLQPLPQPEPNDVQTQLNSLHHLLASTLVLLVVVSGTFCMFVRNQVRTTSSDLQAMRGAWTNAMVQYQHNSPIMDEAAKKFQDFARTNSDFASLLAKYGLKPGAATNAFSATPAAKKK